MTTVMLSQKLPAGYEKIGDGEHSEVWRRPGSRYCIQLFRTDCPELTPAKVCREYAYLRDAYRSMPNLIPRQRLFWPDPEGHVSETLLVKTWIDVDHLKPLNRTASRVLAGHTNSDLRCFIATTRGLLAAAVQGHESFLPDIIDYRFQNLAVDVEGRLRLLDTNRLINTKALRHLPPGQTLDICRHSIHARWLRRLMYLEVAFAGRSRHDLQADPLYTRLLAPPDFKHLHRQSLEEGELM